MKYNIYKNAGYSYWEQPTKCYLNQKQIEILEDTYNEENLKYVLAKSNCHTTLDFVKILQSSIENNIKPPKHWLVKVLKMVVDASEARKQGDNEGVFNALSMRSIRKPEDFGFSRAIYYLMLTKNMTKSAAILEVIKKCDQWEIKCNKEKTLLSKFNEHIISKDPLIIDFFVNGIVKIDIINKHRHDPDYYLKKYLLKH